MLKNYLPPRTRNVFDPASSEPFKISRSKIESFTRCQRCFYIDRRLGVDRPYGIPFTLNIAVDDLLKKEFDGHRKKGTRPPLMEQYGLDLLPAAHPQLSVWRNNLKGVQYLHQPTNFLIFGAIDDLWKNAEEYFVVDYKATSKQGRIEKLDQSYHESYKRQMEIYQWLLRRNEVAVSDTGYFLYCNALKDRKTFDARLDFEMTLIPHQGDDGWVEDTILEMHRCLTHDEIPEAGQDCEECTYRDAVEKVLLSR